MCGKSYKIFYKSFIKFKKNIYIRLQKALVTRNHRLQLNMIARTTFKYSIYHSQLMSKYQHQGVGTQTPHYPFVTSSPYQTVITERIPVQSISQHVATNSHPYYSQTTFYLPARSVQTKVISPSIISSPYANKQVTATFSPWNCQEDIKKIDSRQLQLRRHRQKIQEQQRPSIQSILLRHEDMIQDLSKSNKKVKQQNQQLRVQNTILMEKLAKISRSTNPVGNYEKGNRFKTDDVYETDVDSFAQGENRIRRIRSFENSKFYQDRERTYCEPCLVKCCNKCLKSVMDSKIDQQGYSSEFRQRKCTGYSDRYRQQKFRSKVRSEKERAVQPKHKIPEASEIGWAKQEDINAAIQRLKKQNKILRKHI